MSKGKKRAPQHYNSVALQNWDNAQELISFFFTHTPKAIQNNTNKLKEAIQHLNPTQQKEVQLALEMNVHLSLLAAKFTPEKILETLEFLAHGRAIAYQFTKEDQKRREVFSA